MFVVLADLSAAAVLDQLHRIQAAQPGHHGAADRRVRSPTVTAFVKLFTTRVQMRGEVDPEEYAKAPWYEKQVLDSGERFIKDADGNIESSGY